MDNPRPSSVALAIAGLALSVLACNAPAAPRPTLPPPPPGGAPDPTATVPSVVVATDTPEPGWLPPGTFALYTVGTWETRQLYALSAGGGTDLGRTLAHRVAASQTGRWVAYAGGPPPATSVVILNLETGTAHTVPLSAGSSLYQMAFDPAETRLALLEVGGLGSEGNPWAIVVVDLDDGSTARFEALMPLSDPDVLPGNPIGWFAPGEELLLDVFRPNTEGNWGGVWGVALPPGTPSASFDTLTRRELLGPGDYLMSPRVSPDGTRLLYLNRDFDYTPTGYVVEAYDLAVNQLWTLDVATALPTMLVNVTDGGALARNAAWSPEGTRVIFAQGAYSGGTFAALMLKVRDEAGAVRDVGAVPLPPGGSLQGLHWCGPNVALTVVADPGFDHQLHTVDLASGGVSLVASGGSIAVVGCVR